MVFTLPLRQTDWFTAGKIKEAREGLCNYLVKNKK
jgi:hypothetical protein